MARARGSDATLQLKQEATYGIPPGGGGWKTLPFVSSALGATQGLIESDLLGQGRKPFDPVPDVIVNDGDVVVPIDPLNFGYWLNLLFGPATVSAPVNGIYTHSWSSGAPALPSASIAIGHPQVPSYSTNYGVKANSMRVESSRSGLLNATIGLIAKGETTPAPTTTVPAPSAIDAVTRFAKEGGSVSVDTVTIGSVVSGSFAFSNALDKIETIQPDGEIQDIDPGMPQGSGDVTMRFADHDLLNKAISGVPVELRFRWVLGLNTIVFRFKRVFLPRPKREIAGPGGIMAKFDWQAASGDVAMLIVAMETTRDVFAGQVV